MSEELQLLQQRIERIENALAELNKIALRVLRSGIEDTVVAQGALIETLEGIGYVLAEFER